MGHIINAKEELYQALADRLSRAPEGAPVNEHLLALLRRLYTETEAMIGSKFPLLPLTFEKIAEMTDMDTKELKQILDAMAHKGLLIDIPRKDTVYYMLTPVVVGFFEYTFMRTGDNIRLKELAELFDTYFKSDNVMKVLAGKDTKVMRTLVYENVIPLAVETEVLSYEKASELIRQSGGGAVTICACRHEAEHLGRACDAPQDVCTSLGGAAEWIISKGLGRRASADELLEILDRTTKLGLVHLCDNIMNKPTYICHCCGCCCKVLGTINKQNVFATHPSNFIPEADGNTCISCGVCAEKCPIDAIVMKDDLPEIIKDRCIGCGVCANACPADSLTMRQRAEIHTPPSNLKEKMIRMAEDKKNIL